MAAKQRKKYPDNKYFSISEKNAWSLMSKLHQIDSIFLLLLLKKFVI